VTGNSLIRLSFCCFYPCIRATTTPNIAAALVEGVALFGVVVALMQG
jgi:hypothetical protein